MPRDKKKPSAAEVDAQEIENILGQYIFAVGTGACGQWIRREAIAYLRTHYRKSIANALKTEDWSQDATRILHYMDVIGRLAALKATLAGRDCIDASDISEAVLAVENNYKDQIEKIEPPVNPEGKWCGGSGG